MNFMMLSTLFITAMLWGYFDGLQTIAIKMKYFDLINRNNMIDQDKLKESLNENEFNIYKIGILIKILFYISIVVIFFKISLFGSMIMTTGVILGGYYISNSNILELLSIEDKKSEICDKYLKYSNIALCSLLVYTTSLFVF